MAAAAWKAKRLGWDYLTEIFGDTQRGDGLTWKVTVSLTTSNRLLKILVQDSRSSALPAATY